MLVKQRNEKDSTTARSRSSDVSSHCDNDHDDDKNKKAAKAGLVTMFTPRTIPPFIPAHDIARGIMQSVQSGLTFLFMLAVMYISLFRVLK